MGKQYTQEFREDAVQLVRDSKKSLSEVASDLGVNTWTLRGWVKKQREAKATEGPRRPETLEAENRRLKRELATLKQEREILKKAAAYFAREQL